MFFHVMTLFPQMIEDAMHYSITGRALSSGRIALETVDIRSFNHSRSGRVDDYTYGGGAGMLMQAEPIYDCYQDVISRIEPAHKTITIYVTPQGRPFNQRMARRFACSDELIILCGHYEGVDERVLEEIHAEPVSIGDYVMTGGELASLVIMDTVSRLVPGVLHNQDSSDTESFHGQLLEYPQYTRPEVWRGKHVPDVLLSGNASEIGSWRLTESVKRTRERRADLYQDYIRLQTVRNLLMDDRRSNADMIDLIDAQDAILAVRIQECILLSDSSGDVMYFVNCDPMKLSTEDFFARLYQAGVHIHPKTLICHDSENAGCIEEIMRIAPAQERFLAVYTDHTALGRRRVESFLKAHDGELSDELKSFLIDDINRMLRIGRRPYIYLPLLQRALVEEMAGLFVYPSRQDIVIMHP